MIDWIIKLNHHLNLLEKGKKRRHEFKRGTQVDKESRG